VVGDLTHIHCGADGAIIDCHDREIVGYEFARRGRAKKAERALEESCPARFGTLRPTGMTPVIRSDNGLVYQRRQFWAACRGYRLQQEFITPYTPEQNGTIERFFQSLKEECVWQHLFPSFAAARREIAAWIRWYNEARPHQALGYRTPREHRSQRGTGWLDFGGALHALPGADRQRDPGRRLRRPGRGNPAAASPAEQPVERVRYNRAASVQGTRGELFGELSVPHDFAESSHRWCRPTATALRPMSHPPASVETRTPR
jgi:hypothetical protein